MEIFKKYKFTGIFLLGLVAGPIIFIIVASFFLFSPPAGNQPSSGNLVDLNTEDTADFKFKLDLVGIDSKSLPPAPWKLWVILSSATRPHGNDLGQQVYVSDEIDSLPADVTIKVPKFWPLDFIDRVSKYPPVPGSGENVSISLLLIRGGASTFDPLDLSQVVRQPLAPFFLRAEVFKNLNVREEVKPLDFGRVYFREHFAATPPLDRKDCLGSKGDVSVKIIDVSDQFSKMKKSSTATLVRVQDSWQEFLERERIASVVEADGDYASLFSEVSDVDLSGSVSQIKVSSSLKPSEGPFSHYYLLFCDLGKNKSLCLKSFGESYYKYRKFGVQGSYYPLTPKGLKVPRCDDKELQLYFYPYKAPWTSDKATDSPSRSGGEFPAEIFDSP